MIALVNVSKQYGDHLLLEDSSMQINPGEKIGLVGPNGAGKTTIFRLILGLESPDAGEISKPQKLTIGYFSQDVGDLAGTTAVDYVLQSCGRIAELAQEIKKYEEKFQEVATNPPPADEWDKMLQRFGDLQDEYAQLGGHTLEYQAREILAGLGIGEDQADLPLETFSGGRKMRIALAAILALKPDVLLMDEPTNYLDVESIIWLEGWLKNFKGAILMTCHDREFMNNIVNRIISLENHELVSYSGNYDFYEKEKALRRTQLQAAFERQQQKLAKEEEFIARFAARASHAAQVQSRVKKIEKIERITLPPEEKVIQFSFADPPRSGNDVLKIENLAKNYGEHQVFSGVNALVRRLDKVALVGVNGAGKSTLLKIINQVLPPTSGTCTLGAKVDIGYFGQLSLEILKADHTVLEEAQRFLPNTNEGTLRNLLAAFLFTGDDGEKKVKVLSGGEKSRLVLATILARPVNFLILDEPTNHLDLKSREILLATLQKFQGTVLFVSHDRHFCRQLATRVFEISAGKMQIYEGDYNYYLSKTKHRVHY